MKGAGLVRRERPQAEFLHPFGMASPLMQPMLRRRFRTARGIMPGINRGSIDPHNLAAVELRPDPNYLDAADRWLDDVLQNGGWLVILPMMCRLRQAFTVARKTGFRVSCVRRHPVAQKS